MITGNSQYDSTKGVTSGVPQGSILGPIWFNVFVNDLEEMMECIVIMFADDTKLGSPADLLRKKAAMQRDPDRLKE